MCNLSLLRLHLCWQLLFVEAGLRLKAMVEPTLPPLDNAAERYGQVRVLLPCQTLQIHRLDITFLKSCVLQCVIMQRHLVFTCEEKY